MTIVLESVLDDVGGVFAVVALMADCCCSCDDRFLVGVAAAELKFALVLSSCVLQLLPPPDSTNCAID